MGTTQQAIQVTAAIGALDDLLDTITQFLEGHGSFKELETSYNRAKRIRRNMNTRVDL